MILIFFPSLSYINSPGYQLCWGDMSLSSCTGPAAVNCSEKIYYVQSCQRDSDRTNKQEGGGVEVEETVAVVGILL